MDPVVVGISGGSGAVLAKLAIDELMARNIPVWATCSSAGRQVWHHEMGEPFSRALSEWGDNPLFTYYNINDIGAPLASGSAPTTGMLVMPCSMATVAAIAHGLADNLLRRAADVTLKERRRLIIVPRETPFSSIHLENLLKLSQAGVVVLPPAPAFYLRPKSVEDIARYIAAKALSALGLPGTLSQEFRYQGREERSSP
ncbi:MAG: UbiX family flavin prenyltransferase [Chloroflexi bacterium]|nr:UbiX family flavin prenyltransferase [Chloroflexota bacterium]